MSLPRPQPLASGRFSIGHLSEVTGVSASAIRFYERRGLLSPVGRISGRRVYDESSIRQVNVIQLCAKAGFKVSEIKTLLGANLASRSALAESKRQELDDLVRGAKRAQKLLAEFVSCGCEDLVGCARAVEHARSRH
ncbi:MAG TPA: MerR family transcriptional regulator [Acidimicrobiales bacterium]|nr:MerR family transcriptional regulator [Acidimicrobiales bacterium]